VPKRVSFETARQFFDSKIGWVKKHLECGKRRTPAREVTPLRKINKEHARSILLPRLAELAGRHGFRYAKVSLRRQKTLWASCSSQNNISLNIALATLPQELIDYVLLHELVHTKIKNHSKKFWRELDKYLPNAKHQDRKLRQFCLT